MGRDLKDITSIELYAGSKEERLPGFCSDFPYIASRVDLDQYRGYYCPWHWHRPIELFYVESGALEYCTPGGKLIFKAGSGGMVNSNILHMTRAKGKGGKNIQLLHIFDSSFIGGEQGSRIHQKFIMPVVTASQLEMIPLYPGNPEQEGIIKLIRDSFSLREQEMGYEIKLREALAEIWLQLFAISRSLLKEKKPYDKTNDKLKSMMVYVHEHYAEKISVAELAAAAFCSERECFRAFRNCLHMTPVEYIQSYRLQMACQMLEKSRESMTSVSHACGLGSSSYFGKVFHDRVGCTPLEYRQKWQKSDR